MQKLNQIFYYEQDKIVLSAFWNSLYIAFLLLPLGVNLSTPFFVAAIVLGSVNAIYKRRKFSADNRALFLFPLYFVMLCLSLIYTADITDGIELVTRSLSLLFFPLIFIFVKEDAATVKKLFDFLLVGVLISFFINLGLAMQAAVLWADIDGDLSFSLNGLSVLINVLTEGWEFFIGAEFSQLINPSYVSLYILLVLSYYLKKELQSRLQLAIIMLLFLYLFLLASKVAYFLLAIISLVLIFNIVNKSKKYLVFLVFFLSVFIFFSNPRLFNFYKSVKEYSNTKNYNPSASEKSRLLSWDAATKLIAEAPLFGFGVGDANTVLVEKYKELGYTKNYNNNYNAHNQFLQSFLQNGLLGGGILLFIFIILAKRMKGSLNEMAVLIILFTSLFFEAMLVRFNGIVFFSIVIPLLLKKRSILGGRIIRSTPKKDSTEKDIIFS